MTRDYAKRNTKRKKSKRSSRLAYLWLIIFFLFAGFAVVLLNLSKFQQQLHDLTKISLAPPLLEKKQKKLRVINQQPITDTTTTLTPHKFDFYNILPQEKSNKIETIYELEIAVVKEFAAADRLKAELSLLGFTVNIAPTHKHGIQKYHVSVGPYDNKDGAISDQQKLKQKSIRSLLKKIH